MRKQYISIQDMGTPQQNSFNNPDTPVIPVFTKGRTSIDTIEERINNYHPSYSKEKQPYIEPPYIEQTNNKNPCYETASHISSCLLCQKLFNQDPVIYMMIIAILITIIIVLVMKRI